MPLSLQALLHPTNTIIKFADDTTVIGRLNNLTLNTIKTKELITDFGKNRDDPAPLFIRGESVEIVTSFQFLGTHTSADLSWTSNITVIVKKAQQQLHFLRVLKKNHLVRKSYLTCFPDLLFLTCCSSPVFPHLSFLN